MATILVDSDKCKGCGLCIEVCPKKCLQISKNFNRAGYNPVIFIGENGCTACGFCYLICPDVCIEVHK